MNVERRGQRPSNTRVFLFRTVRNPSFQIMHADAEVIPTLPSRSLPRTIAFYEKLGFVGEMIGDGYAILTLGGIELHFFPHPDLKPEDCYSGCYVRVSEVDRLHTQLCTALLPAKGIPRIETVEDKPWGMREFALIDLDGNLLKFGEVL